MRKRANALEEYVNVLESLLEKCRREHGGVSDNGQSYLKLRPVDPDGPAILDEVEMDYENGEVSDDDSLTQQLCAPAQSLKVC